MGIRWTYCRHASQDPRGGTASSVWRKNGARIISFITEFGFVLSPCFGSEYFPNPSLKEKWPAFVCNTKHIVPNIHTSSCFLNLKLHSQFYKADLVKLLFDVKNKKIFFTSIFQYAAKHVMLLHPVDKLSHSQHKTKISQSKLLYPFTGLKWKHNTMIYTVFGDKIYN